jgi:hypothetical protein
MLYKTIKSERTIIQKLQWKRSLSQKNRTKLQFLSFLILNKPLYNFQNTHNDVFVICRCMKNCHQHGSDQTSANVNLYKQYANNDDKDVYLRQLIKSTPVQNIRNCNAPEHSGVNLILTCTMSLTCYIKVPCLYTYMSLHSCSNQISF